MNLNMLTVNFGHLNQREILSEWQWLIGKGRYPILITALGDAFVQDEKSSEVFYLDTAIPDIRSVASSGEEFEERLSSQEFIEEHIPPRTVALLMSCLGDLKKEEIYSFKVPPFLGGVASSENMDRTRIEVHFSIVGHTARQVKDLPEGTKIGEIKLVLPSKKPWWKLW